MKKYILFDSTQNDYRKNLKTGELVTFDTYLQALKDCNIDETIVAIVD
jgi:hypothetical protein